MNVNEILEFIKDNPRVIAEFIGIIIAMVVYVREVWNGRLKLNEAIVLLVNTLKVEDKMTAEGKFKPELVEAKVQAMGNAIGASQETVQVVQETLRSQDDSLKIGSYKGKAITLNKVVKIGSQLSNALGILRALRGK